MNIDFDLLEKCSKEIYYDNKDQRRSSRKIVVDLFKSLKEENRCILRSDMKKYHHFRDLYYQIQSMEKNGVFPFDIKEVPGVISRHYPVKTIPPLRNTGSTDEPAYVVLMPHVAKRHKKLDITEISSKINMIADEAFGFSKEESSSQVETRLCAVIGINHLRSLIPSRNKKYKKYITTVSELAMTRLSFLGFAWSAVYYDKLDGWSVPESKAKRLMRVFFDLNPQKAKEMADSFASPLVPYQRIREEIKNHSSVLSHVTALRRGKKDLPVGLLTFDDDAVSIRNGIGLFSHYDELRIAHPNAVVMTTGYVMKDPNQSYVEFATRADLENRRAIAQEYPAGVYLPEPNLLVWIQGNAREFISKKFSYLGADGYNLESLRLLENLNLLKIDSVGKIIFGMKGEIQTSIPPRAKVTQSVPELTKNKRWDNAIVTSSLRRYCQSSLNPAPGFADGVTRPTGTEGHKQGNRKHVATLYSCFSPITYNSETRGVKALIDWKDIYDLFINEVIAILWKLQEAECKINYKGRAKRVVKDFPHADVKNVESYLKEVCASGLNAFNEMKKIYSAKERSLITQAALDSGVTNYDFLMSYINSTEYESRF